jgi:hypothetical protein
MAPYRLRVSAIAAKIETTSGTDSVPTLAANAVRFVGVPLFSPSWIESGLRDDVVFAGMGSVARAAPAGRFGTLTVRMEARGTGSTYAGGASIPEPDAFHRAAGFAATNTGATWLYDSLDDGFETMSLYVWTAQKLLKLVGCVVHQKLAVTVNQRAFWDFAVTGIMVAEVTQTVLGAVTHNLTIPPIFANDAVTLGAWNYEAGLYVRSAEVDWPATIATRPAAGAPDGLVGYAITDRKARMTIVAEQGPLATFDPYAIAKQAGSGGVSTIGGFTIGQNAFNRLVIDTGQWALEAPTMGDNTGLAEWSLTGELVAGSLPVNSRESRISYT